MSDTQAHVCRCTHSLLLQHSQPLSLKICGLDLVQAEEFVFNLGVSKNACNSVTSRSARSSLQPSSRLKLPPTTTTTTHCTGVQYILNTALYVFIQPPIPLQPTVQVYSIHTYCLYTVCHSSVVRCIFFFQVLFTMT